MDRTIRPEAPVYRIIQFLGEGLSSCVYKAVRSDPRGHSRQTVVLKILKSETAVAWLRQEFEALSKVRSPHCVQVLGWETVESRPALVLEYVDGVSLWDLGRRFSMTADLIDELTAQIQVGLRDLEERGLCHGDLNPKNILIDRFGRVCLVDFGSCGDSGAPAGTPPYLAPEIWSGEKVSIAADLYALGLIRSDLAHQFSRVPAGFEPSKARCLKATGTSVLTRSDARERQFLPVRSWKPARRRLAARVRTLLDERRTVLATTILEGGGSLALARGKRALRLLRYAASAAVFAISLIALSDENRHRKAPQPESVLEIRTLRWFEIEIDGAPAGFSPLRVTGLRSGKHRITWRTGRIRGEKEIELKPYEVLMLRDHELTGASRTTDQTGKH